MTHKYTSVPTMEIVTYMFGLMPSLLIWTINQTISETPHRRICVHLVTVAVNPLNLHVLVRI